MGIPSWITLSDLGTFPQNTSFDLDPIVLVFSADVRASIVLLNGSLPSGLTYVVNPGTISITGAAQESNATIESRFTFRIKQPTGEILDRTFFLILTPLDRAPSWSSQETFLGYQSNVSTIEYQLTAIPPNGDRIFYDLPISSSNTFVDKISGKLRFDSNSISTDTTVSTVVRATADASGGQSNVTVHINVLTSARPPGWVTSSGLLGSYYGNDFVELELLAEDPFAESVIYSLLSYDIGFPLAVSSTGVVYGRLPNPLINKIWHFTVRATGLSGHSDRSFTILVQPSIKDNLLVWETDSDLGSITEGEIINLTVRATSSRSTTLIYNITGGLLPPHLMLGTTTGTMIGFCEYHAVAKTYRFDITVTDGYQSLTKQFSLSVNKIYGDQFFGINIPMTGELRNAWAINGSNIRVRVPGEVAVNTLSGLSDPPTLTIIDGLVTDYATPDDLVSLARPWLNQLDLRIGSSSNTSVLSTGTSIVYTHISDQQHGSNLTIQDSNVPLGIVYPISIDNIRQSISKNFPYIGEGGGSGCHLSPTVDYSNGSLASVEVIDPGTDYTFPPTVIVGGSGNGAKVRTILGLLKVDIEDGGSSWSVGDSAYIIGNQYHNRARILVTSVDDRGSIVSVEIVEQGDYTQISASPISTINNGYSVVTLKTHWGVVSAEVLEGGSGYGCGITIEISGSEILPPWQLEYSPVIEVGYIPVVTAKDAASIFDIGTNSLYGKPWQPNYMVFQWQGLRWMGTTSFEEEITTFDGNTTRFEETEDPLQTVFDDNRAQFDKGMTIFDTMDPIRYDLFQLWGSTIFEEGTTVFDLYSTIFDSMSPRLDSNTRLRKWIRVNNKIYSGNNVVW